MWLPKAGAQRCMHVADPYTHVACMYAAAKKWIHAAKQLQHVALTHACCGGGWGGERPMI